MIETYAAAQNAPVAPSLRILKFWTTYKASPTPEDPDRLVEVDWVAYGPVGNLDKSITEEKISRLRMVPVANGDNNPAVAMARMRWEFIKPRYEAWKKGQEVPTDGTPLAAWNGLTTAQAEVLKGAGIRTLEEFVGLNDAATRGIRLPNLRALMGMAKQYLAASSTRSVAAELAQRDQKISEQTSIIEEMKKQLDELASVVAKKIDDGVVPEPKRRGRPPKEVPFGSDAA
jgi:hypothetical protein